MNQSQTIETGLLPLIAELRDANIRLWAENGALRFAAPPNALTGELRARIVEKKSALLDFLSKARASSDSSVIERASRARAVPASFAQQRLWFIDQFDPGGSAYNIPTAIKLSGALNTNAVTRTINEIVRRHEVLRTTFAASEELETDAGKQLIQVIHPYKPFDLDVVDLESLALDEREPRARQLAAEEAARPFELSVGPLIRASLLRLSDDEHVVLLTLHHIVSDEWSMGLLVKEVAALYEAYAAGAEYPLPELSIQYADFAVWQRQWLQGEVLEKQRNYWIRQLADLPTLDLLTDRPRTADRSYEGGSVGFRLPDDVARSLRSLNSREGTTLFMAGLAAWQLLLWRYTGNADIVVGTAIAGRNRAETENLIGYFVNTLVLRTDLSGDPAFTQLLARVRDTLLAAYAHQDIPFEHLVEILQPVRDPSRHPLFQIAISLQNSSASDSLSLPGLALSSLPSNSQVAKFDLTFDIVESPDAIMGQIQYAADLFDAATIERMAGHLQCLLSSIATTPDRRITDLAWLTEEERHEILIAFNANVNPPASGPGAMAVALDSHAASDQRSEIRHGSDLEADSASGPGAMAVALDSHAVNKKGSRQSGTAVQGDGRGTQTYSHLVSLFEAQASRTPDAEALVFGGDRLTYADLNARANQIACHLRALGAGPETCVVLYTNRSCESVIGLLGILKAGAAYVPVDPEHHSERLPFILEDTQAAALLTHSTHIPILPEYSGAVVCLDTHWPEIARLSPENASVNIHPENLAYVIYTSGSTGLPKGVCVTHAALTNLVLSARDTYGLGPGDRVLQFASLSFDVSVEELLPSLIGGATVVIRPEDFTASFADINRTIHEQRLTVLNLPGSFWHNWCAHLTPEDAGALASVRLIIAGSEAVLSDDIIRWRTLFGGGVRLLNAYGPTEATVTSVIHEPQSSRLPVGGYAPIGWPIANTSAYILAADMTPVAVGIPGELYLGGACLARGYLNSPDLTAAKFVPNPFSPHLSTRLYKTGDRARYGSDGNIEFLGRIDQQVKIRGFRIELGEIEAVLVQHGGVTAAVAVAHGDERQADSAAPDGGDKRLVAYVVPADEGRFDIAELRSFLKARLPDYMVPAAFVVIDSVPKTPGGKVDRKALPAPDQSAVPETSFAPRTVSEELIAQIWSDVLRVDRIGRDAHFFELGGHSLLATQVISRVRKAFHVEVPLRALFEAPTLPEFAERVERLTHASELPSAPDIVAVDRSRPLPLSFAQQRLWFIDQLEAGSAVYNMPIALRLAGPFDAKAMERTINEIVMRHEVLRTTFSPGDTQPVQIIHPYTPFKLTVTDLAHLPAAEREARATQLAEEEAGRPFDLAEGPVLRAQLIRLAAQDHVALLTIHHITGDAWSIGLLIDEVATLYTAISKGLPSLLPALPIQYADYAVWQRNWLQGEALDGQLGYWRRQLADLPTLELPTDRPRPPMQSYRGATAGMRLPVPVADDVKRLCRREGATLFMALLAAWQLLLSRYSGQDDIVLGTAIAGRTRAETENLIGLFLNALVLRADLSGNPTFTELLERVREVCLGAYGHQDIPFEQLVDALQPQRDMSRNSLFQIIISVENTPVNTTLSLPEISLSRVETDNSVARFDMAIFQTDSPGGLNITVVYAADLFDGDTMDRMLGHLANLIGSIVAEPGRRIGDLSMLSDSERRQLLVAFNDTRADYPHTSCVHHLFEKQTAETPNAIAAVFEDRTLTYAALNARANQVAHYLQTLGVGPETLVGVCLARGIEMVVAVLGVLKAGGAYVPLDPGLPPERLAFMAADAGLMVALTTAQSAHCVPADVLIPIVLDGRQDALDAMPVDGPPCAAGSENLAYVIYTSGSTGQPKGSLIIHGGLVNYLHWAAAAYDAGRGGGSPLHSSLGFDLTVTSLFPALLSGKPVTLLPAVEPVEELTRAMADAPDGGWTLLKLTPAHLKALQNMVSPASAGGPRALVIGGEALLASDIEFWRTHAPSVRLINEYGPTEAVVGCCVYEVDESTPHSGAVPIGRPIANTQLYVLDRSLEPLPVGVPGELYIGGDGLARGYLNRPDLTSEAFIANPLAPDLSPRLYRTGDRVRRLANGDLEYLGRIDETQVKIRGYRIELGEIEAALTRNPAVKDAVVLAREDTPGDKRLVAYVVAAGTAPTPDALRTELLASLPDYMVPAMFVVLDALPLSHNGKVNRKALPEPESPGSTDDNYVAPRSAIEQELADLWIEVLKVDRVGIHDNFFALGGHSLLLTSLASRIRTNFRVEVPLRVLFDAPTIVAMTEAISEKQLEAEDGEDLSMLLDELENLSPEEIAAMLAAEAE